MYYHVFDISNIVFYCLLGLSVLFLIFKIILHIFALKPQKKFPEAKKEHRYAILVPARDESKVIKKVLNSIKEQNYNHDLLDIFVIVENEKDPTCMICKEYDNTSVIVRKHLELKSKGYALDEALQYIRNLENVKNNPNYYEAYFIFDADNTIDKNFLHEMNKVYDLGYDMAIGYRNNQDWNASWVSACSGITFTVFSRFSNLPRSKMGMGVRISGTGYYISSRLLNKIGGGWKFVTLTEDHEISMYAILNNVKSTYNENAIFYDEQPNSYKQSWTQRVRWCKGFSQANKIYAQQLLKNGFKQKQKPVKKFDKIETSLGIFPFIFVLAILLLYTLYNLVYMFIGIGYGESLWFLPAVAALGALAGLYLFLMLYTILILALERKNIKVKFWKSVICVLMNPIFMLSYIPIYFTSKLKKNIGWSKIEHGEKKSC